VRASRLLSILILLQLRTRLTAEALAREFEVSVRTIYRDIDTLSAAGVPIYGDRGPGGGFQLVDGYRTRLTGLADDEAGAMLMIGLPEQARALGFGDAATRARNKLLAALPKAGSDEASRIAGRFHLDTVDWYRSARPVPHLTAIARAVLDRRRLEMTYESWTATRDWSVKPLGLVLKAGHWYLVAHGAGQRRIFSVADVKACAIRDETFDEPAGFDLPGWWGEQMRAFEARLRPGTAKLHASPIGLRRLRLLGAFASEAVSKAGPPDAAGWRAVDLPLETIDAAAPMLLGIGPEIDVIEPPQLRTAIGALARAVARRMGRGPD
jgi:predicted DNA-binding transcriptional regulator YafY